MARIRTIKPEFWTDSKTGTLSGSATKLFLGILNHCDDYGVIKMDLMELKAKILPYEPGDSLAVITPLLFEELLPKCLLTLFQYSDKDDGALQQYLYVSNFTKHQRIDKPGLPTIDKWLKTDCLDSFMGRIAEHSTNVLVTFSPEGKGKEGNGDTPPNPLKEGEPKKRTRRTKQQTLSGYSETARAVVNRVLNRWPKVQPGDGKPIVKDVAMTAQRIDDLLKLPDVTSDVLEEAAEKYLSQAKQYYKYPQFFFGPGNGDSSSNWVTYARAIIDRKQQEAIFELNTR